MSYILEALKKAEAERRSGSAPSIHAPHSFAPPRAARAWWQHPATWAAAVTLLVAAALAGWLLARPSAPPAPAVQLAAAPAPTEAAAPAASAAPAPAPTPAPSPPAAAAPAPAEPPAPVAPKAAPADTPPAAPATREPKAEVKPRPEPKPKPRKQEQKAASAAPAQEPAQAPAPPLRELPEHIQREIPPLQIGGYIYSSVPADRSVLINKRLLREGDEVAPGLVLERMTSSGMVLNYRGHRYRSSY